MNEYTTIARIRAYLGFDSVASASSEEDALLVSFVQRASRSIDKYTRRKFYPRIETRFYDHKDARQLRLDDDLLQVNTFKTLNGACTVASSVMWLSAGENWNRLPADRIVLAKDSGSVLNFSGTPQRANEVTGVWGYHENWREAWTDTGACLAADYGASGGSISLAGAGSVGAGASDVDGNYPRISVGNLLKIGDEYLHVAGGAASGNGTVLVKGFGNGTTAASHASGASIARFEPEADIEWSARRLAAWMYGQKATPYTNRVANLQLGTFEIPESMPGDVRDRLERFVRRSIEIFPGK